MTTPPTHADAMRDHWWWRPGWRRGRQFYTWHLTFTGQHQRYDLVDDYQQALRPLPQLDLIPHQWLHLTMQGVGFTDQVTEADARRIADAAVARLAVAVREASLIILNRDHRMYEWQTYASAPLSHS